MNDIVRIGSTKRSSRVVVHGGLVYVSGMTADDRDDDIEGQTSQVLAKIDRCLAEAGTNKSRLLSAQIWLRDIGEHFARMNEIWNAWTAPDAAPTRATAECRMASQDILIEIVVTAAAPVQTR
jgi:enamine deaminase RidA (YjgF/YER057c/UK114 family)